MIYWEVRSAGLFYGYPSDVGMMAPAPLTKEGWHDTRCRTVPSPARAIDWRVPNVTELQRIVNYEIEFPGPAVSPASNNLCVAGCSRLTCSCTQAGVYWSSSSDASGPQAAWSVYFDAGYVLQNPKTGASYVRAVRGGS